MTVRRSKKPPSGPEEIAARVHPAARTVFQETDDYRAFSRALTEEVEEITGQYDLGLAQRVAAVLGVSVVDWFKRQLLSS